MDPTTLATTVMHILLPILPFLSSAGGALAAGMGGAIATKAGEEVFQQSKEGGKRLFAAIHDRFVHENDNGSAVHALDTLAAGDQDYAVTVQTKLERILRADPTFAAELLQLIHSGPLQSLIVGEEATARAIDFTNSLGAGSQQIQTGKGSTAEEISMNIAHPDQP